jgi:hypothetical protein
MSSSLGICHWRDSNEDGKYDTTYSTGYRITNIVQIVIVVLSLAANVFSLLFIRMVLTNAPQVSHHHIPPGPPRCVTCRAGQVVRDRQTARIERYMFAFVIVWALRVTSNFATCHDIYPGPGNITFWIWLAPGGWGLVNALILGTSRFEEAKEFFSSAMHQLCCCCYCCYDLCSPESDQETPGDSLDNPLDQSLGSDSGVVRRVRHASDDG